jgi:hypothetical protein
MFEHTRKETLLEPRCGKNLSGAINGAPPWNSQYRVRPEEELAAGQAFDDEHAVAADRTARLGSNLGIACAGRSTE